MIQNESQTGAAAVLMEYLHPVLDAASLMWMELAMFVGAAICYVVFTKSSQLQGTGVKSKKIDDPGTDASSTEKELLNKINQNDHRVVVRLWQRVKSQDTAPNVPIIGVVNAMRMLGWPISSIVEELKSALDCNPALLDGIMEMLSLPGKEGIDDAKLLNAVISMLEERGHQVEAGAWNKLMAAQLRQKDIDGLIATEQNLRQGIVVNSRIRAALVAASAQRGRLDAALGHLQQLQGKEQSPSNAKKETSQVSVAASVGTLLALAAREGRVIEVAELLDKAGIVLDVKQLMDALAEACKSLNAAVCLEVMSVAASQLPKAPATTSARAHEGLSKSLGEDSARVTLLLNTIEDAELSDQLHDFLLTAVLDGIGTLADQSLLWKVMPKALERFRAGGAAPHAVTLGGAVAKSCYNCELYEEACNIYEKDMAPSGMQLDSQLAEVLMKAAVQAGKGDLAQSLFDKTPSDASASKYVAEIKLCGRKRDLRGANDVFNKMKGSGIPLNTLVYNCLLDACIQCGDLSGALQHFQQMKKLDFVDVVSYNTVLKAYLGLNKIEEAQALLREMSARGLPANKVTYNELLHARVLAKDRRGMWTLLEEMRNTGIKANAVTCSILLKSLTENSHSSDAEKVMKIVEETEEQMDEVLFSSVIEACIRLHRLDLLSSMMRKFEKRGRSLSLTAPTYGSMIKAYGQSHDVERIWELWHEMDTRGVKPTAITLGCMVDALVMNSRVDDAWKLVNELLEDQDLAPSVNTVIFSTVLKGFAMLKQTERVFAVHQEMCDRDIQCNTITYNTMFDACARCGTMDRVPKLLEDMRRSQAEPDIITYSTLVKGFCLTGDVDRAFRVLEEMTSDGKFAPDEIMYNSLLDGCAKLHRVDEAQKLLDEMQANGVNPSNYTLSILVKLFGRTRRLNQAFKIVDTLAEKNGLRPNIHVYTCLMQACIQNRDVDRALGLHDTMVSDSGVWPDEKCYSVLVRGCLQSNRPDKAASTIRCAFGLTGHSMVSCWNDGAAPGVEHSIVAETVSKLKEGRVSDQELGRQLVDDLEAQGHQIDFECTSPNGNYSRKGSGKGGFSSKGGGKGGRKGKGKGGSF